MIVGGFGFQIDTQNGALRRWYWDRSAGARRWADNDQLVEDNVTEVPGSARPAALETTTKEDE